jgi:hypothetical protein
LGAWSKIVYQPRARIYAGIFVKGRLISQNTFRASKILTCRKGHLALPKLSCKFYGMDSSVCAGVSLKPVLLIHIEGDIDHHLLGYFVSLAMFSNMLNELDVTSGCLDTQL